MKNENPIVQAIKHFKAQELAITADWNAGGDECICTVKIGSDENKRYEDIYICDVLVSRIIDRLDLPDAGEVFHNGDGIIDLNENGDVFIRFTASFGYTDYGDYHSYYDTEDFEEDDDEYNHPTPKGKLKPVFYTLPFQDPLKLSRFLHRADIRLHGRINEELLVETNLNIRVHQGDEIVLTEEENAFYHQFIEKQLLEQENTMRTLEEEFKKDKKYYPFRSLLLRGTLQPDATIDLEIRPSNEYFTRYVNHETILFENETDV